LRLQHTDLVKIKRGRPDQGGGTWLHPDLAIEFARWCSPKFSIWCNEQIKEILIQLKAGSSQVFFRPSFPTFFNQELGFDQVNEPEDRYCKTNRVVFDHTIKVTCGLRNPIFIRQLTNLVFRILTGFEVKDFRRGWGIPKGSRIRTRLFMDTNLRRAIDVVEIEGTRIIRQSSITDFQHIFSTVEDLATAQMLLCRANHTSLFTSVPVNLRLVSNAI
jgi:hypothetical protein